MSSQKGNVKKNGQKYQNTFAFKHNKNSMVTRKIIETPLDLLCEKCLNILEWKIKFRKYKPLSVAAKCKICENKHVYKGHRTICDKCAAENKLCSKCIEPVEEYGKPTRSSKVLRSRPKDTTFEEILACLKERHRRTVLRKIEDGEDIVFDENKGIINDRTQEVVVDLRDINSGVLLDKSNDDADDIEEDNEEENEGKENQVEIKKEDKDDKKEETKEEEKSNEIDNK